MTVILLSSWLLLIVLSFICSVRYLEWSDLWE